MIVSVASGKGGTGKTLVATSLAISLKTSRKVQLLDCDVEEPNAHIFLGVDIVQKESVRVPVPVIDEERCTHCGRCAEVCAFNSIAVFPTLVMTFPELCHGCGACSYLCPEEAIHEEGREVGIVERGYSDGIELVHGKLATGEAMAPPVIRRVKEFINPAATTIIDVSPGTSCPMVESVRDSDFCILVTEPTPFGLNDLILAVETVRELGIPFGVVLNRVGIGDAKVEEYCREEDIPILLTIPLDIEIARLYSKGMTLVEGMPQWKERFVRLSDRIMEMVDERSCCPER